MGMSAVSKSQVSRLREEIDGRVQEFLNRPIEGDWPYLWIDATYVKTRQAGRGVSVSEIIAVAVATACGKFWGCPRAPRKRNRSGRTSGVA